MASQSKTSTAEYPTKAEPRLNVRDLTEILYGDAPAGCAITS
jgi:hypothetical protein